MLYICRKRYQLDLIIEELTTKGLI